MRKIRLNDIEIEYDVTGSGEPLLLIAPVIADGCAPLARTPELRDRYQVITYHKRGWAGSTHPAGPISVADHVTDAVALLDHVGIARAHVAGHSSGGLVALQLALEHPTRVHSLVLLEPTMFTLPQGQAFLGGAGPIVAAYQSGDKAGALAMFFSAASGLEWERCRAVMEANLPGVISDTVNDADTLFGSELPQMIGFQLPRAHAATIVQPTLSILGGDSGPIWVEIDRMLHDAMPHVETRSIAGVGHLLQMQNPAPVARAIAAFLARQPMPNAVPSSSYQAPAQS
jgi:pimeloyl-ACP methyl ester carboxylesterase